jgi:plastocyanin
LVVETYLDQHDVQPVTIEKLRYPLSKATAVFGDRSIGELTSEEIAAWRMTLSPDYRFEATQALPQVLRRAVAWGMLDVNPAKVGVDNPARRRKEQHPFESWSELEALAAAIGPRYGPMILFAFRNIGPAQWSAKNYWLRPRLGVFTSEHHDLAAGRVLRPGQTLLRSNRGCLVAVSYSSESGRRCPALALAPTHQGRPDLPIRLRLTRVLPDYPGKGGSMKDKRWQMATLTLAAVITAIAAIALAGLTAQAATTTTRVKVTEREYRILLRTHSFKPGRVTFVVTNHGMLAHEFAVSGPGVHKRIPGKLRPGVTRTLTVRLSKGKYTLKCPIHVALGMKTTIRVG